MYMREDWGGGRGWGVLGCRKRWTMPDRGEPTPPHSFPPPNPPTGPPYLVGRPRVLVVVAVALQLEEGEVGPHSGGVPAVPGMHSLVAAWAGGQVGGQGGCCGKGFYGRDMPSTGRQFDRHLITFQAWFDCHQATHALQTDNPPSPSPLTAPPVAACAAGRSARCSSPSPA